MELEGQIDLVGIPYYFVGFQFYSFFLCSHSFLLNCPIFPIIFCSYSTINVKKESLQGQLHGD
uniref:Uncharacterized protein n=1 Tax=Anguilla anguilla TaxID=7936 RepID=A0A0E9SUV8_ANGAN